MVPGFPASLFELIAERLDVDLVLDTTQSGPPPDDDPFADGRFDLGWICSTSFIDLSLRSDDPSVQLAGVAWVPDDPQAEGRPVYFSDLVIGPNSTATTLDDLRGARIGCNDPVSLSGHHALRFEIERRGGDPDTFAELVFTGGHETSLSAVIAGDVDAAVIDSVVRIRRSRIDPAIRDLPVIDRLGPWPVQPLVVRRSIGDAERQSIADAVLALNDDPAIRSELQTAALVRFVTVDADHYEPVRAAMSRP